MASAPPPSPEIEQRGERPPGLSADSRRGEAAGGANPSHAGATTPGQRRGPASRHPAQAPGPTLRGVCRASAALPPNSPDSGSQPSLTPGCASAKSPQLLKSSRGGRRSGAWAQARRAAAALEPAAYRRRGRQARGFPPSRRHPKGIPHRATREPAFLLHIAATGFYPRNGEVGLRPLLPRPSLPTLATTPIPAERLSLGRRTPKAFGKFRLQRGGRGRSSSSGPSSAVSVRGRCALGTGLRWLAPWLRLLSRRRLLLPVARAAGRSGVLVSDAAEV